MYSVNLMKLGALDDGFPWQCTLDFSQNNKGNAIIIDNLIASKRLEISGEQLVHHVKRFGYLQ